jgi:hypothetical protein
MIATECGDVPTPADSADRPATVRAERFHDCESDIDTERLPCRQILSRPGLFREQNNLVRRGEGVPWRV